MMLKTHAMAANQTLNVRTIHKYVWMKFAKKKELLWEVIARLILSAQMGYHVSAVFAKECLESKQSATKTLCANLASATWTLNVAQSMDKWLTQIKKAVI